MEGKSKKIQIAIIILLVCAVCVSFTSLGDFFVFCFDIKEISWLTKGEKFLSASTICMAFLVSIIYLAILLVVTKFYNNKNFDKIFVSFLFALSICILLMIVFDSIYIYRVYCKLGLPRRKDKLLVFRQAGITPYYYLGFIIKFCFSISSILFIIILTIKNRTKNLMLTTIVINTVLIATIVVCQIVWSILLSKGHNSYYYSYYFKNSIKIENIIKIFECLGIILIFVALLLYSIQLLKTAPKSVGKPVSTEKVLLEIEQLYKQGLITEEKYLSLKDALTTTSSSKVEL